MQKLIEEIEKYKEEIQRKIEKFPLSETIQISPTEKVPMTSTSFEKEKQLALEALKDPEKLVTEIERGNVILLIGIMSAAPHIANEIINLSESKVLEISGIYRQHFGLNIGGEMSTDKEIERKPETERLLVIPANIMDEIKKECEGKSLDEKLKVIYIFCKNDGALGLRYSPVATPLTVQEFLDQKEGECNEFSTLIYSVGRQLGIPVQIISLRAKILIENENVLDVKGHSFCVVKEGEGYYVLDGAEKIFGYYKGNLDEVVSSHLDASFKGYSLLGSYFVSSNDSQVKGIYLAEFGVSSHHTEWLEDALTYGYTPDYVYFALAWLAWVDKENEKIALDYLDKVRTEDELTLSLRGALFFCIGKYDESEAVYIKLKGINPYIKTPYIGLLKIYSFRDDKESMTKILEEAEKIGVKIVK